LRNGISENKHVSPAGKIGILHRPLPVGVAAELGASWAGRAMHKVVALASFLRQPLAGWRLLAV